LENATSDKPRTHSLSIIQRSTSKTTSIPGHHRFGHEAHRFDQPLKDQKSIKARAVGGHGEVSTTVRLCTSTMASSTVHTSLALGLYVISATSRVAVSLVSKAVIARAYTVNLTLLAAAVTYQAVFFLSSYIIGVLSHIYLAFASCALNVAYFTTALVSAVITPLLVTLVPYVIAAVSSVFTNAFDVCKTLKSNAISLIPYIIKVIMLLSS
jgi:hypothetical protein